MDKSHNCFVYFKFLFAFSLFLSVLCFPAMTVRATDLDGLTATTPAPSSAVQSDNSVQRTGAVADFVDSLTSSDNYLTGKDMVKAQKTLSPVTSIVGYLLGVALLILNIGCLFYTMFDLLALVIKGLRPFLASHNLISDEMTALLGTSGAPQGMQGAQGGYGVGGYGVGGYGVGGYGVGGYDTMNGMNGANGMGGMNGAAGMNQQGTQQGTKEILVTYLKKRAFFYVLLMISFILLTSSVFMNCGLNIAKLAYNAMSTINGKLG